MAARVPPPQEDLFAYAARRAAAPRASPAPIPPALPQFTPASVLARAKALARLSAAAPPVTRDDGVVPITSREAVRWCREHDLEWPGDDGIRFKLAVRDGRFQNSLDGVVAVCLGTAPLDAPPSPPGRYGDTIELSVIAPRHEALRFAYQVALDRGARAALALGYRRVEFYRLADPGHAFHAFHPLPPRDHRLAEGGSLPWRAEGIVEARPWIRFARERPSRALRRRDLVDRQTDAILEWEDAVEEQEDALGRPLEEEELVQLADTLGFDYYEGWRPSEMIEDDAEPFVDLYEGGAYERFVVEAPPSTRPLFAAQIPLDSANEVLPRWHSHLPEEVKGHLFSVGVFAREVPGSYPEHLRAVAVVSMPVAQAFTGRDIVEVVRVAVGRDVPPLAGVSKRSDGRPHASGEASFALGRAAEASAALGFSRVLSSTLLGERGASYEAAGWRAVAVGRGGEWARKGRARKAATQPGYKIRWEVGAGAATPVVDPAAGTVLQLVKDAFSLYKAGAHDPALRARFPLGGVAPAASGGALPPSHANDRAAWLRECFAVERRRFARAAGVPTLATAQLHLVATPCSPAVARCGVRDVAWCRWYRGRAHVYVLQRALDLPRENLLALLRHELGHLVDPQRHAPGSEQRADDLAAHFGGALIRYDDHGIQTVGPGRYPRPPELPS